MTSPPKSPSVNRARAQRITLNKSNQQQIRKQQKPPPQSSVYEQQRVYDNVHVPDQVAGMPRQMVQNPTQRYDPKMEFSTQDEKRWLAQQNQGFQRGNVAYLDPERPEHMPVKRQKNENLDLPFYE